jgi:formate dehydrogenase maturation protein FdhE
MVIQMAQHFLLSPAAKTLSLAKVLRMTDKQAEKSFAAIRWHETDGAPVCPVCGVDRRQRMTPLQLGTSIRKSSGLEPDFAPQI